RVFLLTPQNEGDLLGLRAIDGATLDPSTPDSVEFTVAPVAGGGGDAGAGTAAGSGAPTTSFCTDVLPLLTTRCGSAVCHGGTDLPAEGLRLDSAAAVSATAIGRVAQESNTGPS